jgi:hypothetical protein
MYALSPGLAAQMMTVEPTTFLRKTTPLCFNQQKLFQRNSALKLAAKSKLS